MRQNQFSITYLAEDLALSHFVAIKEFYPFDWVTRSNSGDVVPKSSEGRDYEPRCKHLLDGIHDEWHRLDRLDHPNSEKISKLFEEHNTAYLVVENIEGRTLKDELAEQGKLSEPLVQKVLQSLVRALELAHSRYVYHLDITAENVMFANDGRVVLVGFGAPWGLLNYFGLPVHIPSTAPLGMERYNENGARNDIYELSALAHQMLTGTAPPEYQQRIEQGMVDWTPDLPEPWRSLIRAGLQVRPTDRPHDVRSWWKLFEGMSVRGDDDFVEILVTAEEARIGCLKTYVTKDLKQDVFFVPSDTIYTSVFRVPGKGLEGRGGGEPGDLFVKVLVASSPNPTIPLPVPFFAGIWVVKWILLFVIGSLSVFVMKGSGPGGLVSPTPTPTRIPTKLPYQVQRAQAKALREFKTAQGQIGYDFPAEMKTGQTLVGSVGISQSQKTNLPARSGKGNIKTEPLTKSAPTMKVTARAIDDTALQVKSMSEDDQPIIKDGFTRWNFSIKALRAGLWDIEIHAKIPYPVQGKLHTLDVPVKTKRVSVAVDPWYQIEQWDWKWVFTTIFGGSASLWAGLKWLAGRTTKGAPGAISLNPDGSKKIE